MYETEPNNVPFFVCVTIFIFFILLWWCWRKTLKGRKSKDGSIHIN